MYTGSGPRIAVSWLPSVPSSSFVRTETGTSARISSPSVRTPRERSQPRERARDDRQHDVVDRAAERVLDLLVVGQLLADDGEPAVGADLDVERRLGRRVQPGPDDLADPLGGVAERAATCSPGGSRPCTARVAMLRRGVARPRARRRATSSAGDGSDCGCHGSRSVGGRRRVRAEIEQDGREVDAGDAVDERVVGLEDQREPIALEPLDEPALPQRLGAVELLGGDPRREQEQLLLGPGRRQRGVADVVLEVEVRVVDPQRPAGLERRRRELLPVARDEVQPSADVVEVVRRTSAAGPRTSAPRRCACATTWPSWWRNEASIEVRRSRCCWGMCSPCETSPSGRVKGTLRRDGLGFLDRARVPEQARLDARVRARADLAARDADRRARVGRADPRDRAAAGAGQGAAACGPRTSTPNSAVRGSAR